MMVAAGICATIITLTAGTDPETAQFAHGAAEFAVTMLAIMLGIAAGRWMDKM